ncbi:leucine-rich repeat extensin-like protein 3 [Senna tora]|uniref:Leucine-rich repeat extensin-like protein 3 n=1 Tax=Senna tora TaxID=362788 RepID=A0A834U123_9FABA|nr:leucine-rich repeat extensin-like protein 3 [Senna tora]
MDHRRSSGFFITSWFCWFLRVGLVGLVVFAKVTSQDKVEAPPSNLLCISECGTCPVICSPPPPAPLLTYYPPPSSPDLPRSPPPETPHSPAPLYFTYPPPLPKSPPSLPPPPPPPTPSTHPSGAAPPPPSKSYNSPPSASGSGQPTVISGPHQYSYPYYYYYASGSHASSPSIHAPFLLSLLFLIHRMLFCW